MVQNIPISPSFSLLLDSVSNKITSVTLDLRAVLSEDFFIRFSQMGTDASPVPSSLVSTSSSSSGRFRCRRPALFACSGATPWPEFQQCSSPQGFLPRRPPRRKKARRSPGLEPSCSSPLFSCCIAA